MKSDLDSFNAVARQYDFLKQLVFGQSIYQSQACFLPSIPQGCKVLVIGGGSGEILPVLAESNPNAEVWFVEASSAMLRLARKRLSGKPAAQVRFIHGTELDLPDRLVFDVIITNFFLDLFPDGKLRGLCTLLAARLSTGGLWLVSDFVDGNKIWQRFLLWSMYRFFMLISRVKTHRLPAWGHHIRLAGMEEISSRSFFGAFIRSVLYRKESTR